MGRVAVLAVLVTALLCIVVGCKTTISPTTDDVMRDSSVTTSSEALSSCTPVSSGVQNSSTLASSKDTSSMTSSEANMPVKHPNYGQSVEQPKEQTKEECEAEMAEIERLSKLPAEYTTVFEQEVYPVGTDIVSLIVTNKGPGSLEFSNGYRIDRFDGSEWICLNPNDIPTTIGYDPLIPEGTLTQRFGRSNMFTEAGKYRLRLEFSHGGKDEERIIEFTVE